MADNEPDRQPDRQPERQPEQQSPRGQDVSERAGILPPHHWTAHVCGRGHGLFQTTPSPAHASQDARADADADHDDDGDSALGDDDADSTASLTSSILRYRSIHGRTYHSERGNAQYWYGSSDAPTCSFAWRATVPLTNHSQGGQR